MLWILPALLSALFASLVAIFGKIGLAGVDSTLATSVRAVVMALFLIIVSFALGSIHSHDVASIVNEDGIAIRSGHHCAMPLMKRMGVSDACRASFYLYNEEREVDMLAESLEKAKKIFGE